MKAKLICALFSVLCGCEVLTGAEAGPRQISGFRPLAKAADELSLKYGIPINYEDPVYQSTGDFENHGTPTSPGAKAASFNLSLRLRRSCRNPFWLSSGKAASFNLSLRLRQGTVNIGSVDSKLGAHHPDQVAPLLEAAVEEYAAKDLPGRFQVNVHDDAIFIAPTFTKNKRGVLIATQSPLDVQISLESKDRSGEEIIDDICKAVSTAGVHVGFAVGPTNYLMQTHTTMSANHEPARAVLLRALSSLRWKEPVVASRMPRKKLQWRLLYDAGVGYYLMNILGVNEEVATPQGGTMVQAVDQ